MRVLLADDHAVVRQGLRALLEEQAGVTVVGEAGDGREAVRLAETLRPDVVVMDIGMSGLNGLEATEQIRTRVPGVSVVILSMHSDPALVRRALQIGASGYVLKESVYDELRLAIEASQQGRIYLSPTVTEAVVEGYLEGTKPSEAHRALEQLTPREREVLQLLAEGHSRQEMAAILNISPKTVSRHRENLLDKLGLRSDAELVQFALEAKLIGGGNERVAG